MNIKEIEKKLNEYDLQTMNLLDLNMLTIFLDVATVDKSNTELSELLLDKLNECEDLFNDRLENASAEEIESLDTSEEHTQTYIDFIEYVQSL